jgi:hypothetical protein
MATKADEFEPEWRIVERVILDVLQPKLRACEEQRGFSMTGQLMVWKAAITKESIMTRLALVVVVLYVVVFAGVTQAQDKIVGAAWEVKFGPMKDSIVRIRATPDGKVYDRGSEAVGAWKGDQEKVEMEITGFKGKQAQFNGTYVLTQIAKEGRARWSGKWTPPGGARSKNVAVRLLKD